MPTCLRNKELITDVSRHATNVTEILGSIMLAVGLYEGAAGVFNAAQLNIKAAEQYGIAAGSCMAGAVGFWAVGMALVPRLRDVAINQVHRRSDCAWDDDWQTDGKSGNSGAAEPGNS